MDVAKDEDGFLGKALARFSWLNMEMRMLGR